MKRHMLWLATLVALSGTPIHAAAEPAAVTTTGGEIAIENLDFLIAQRGNQAAGVELLLTRARFLGDYASLDRACVLAESRFRTSPDLLQRARARSAVHRFADALSDADAAARAGANRDEVAALRASILVATGRAREVVAELEAGVVHHPGYASRSALAGAYAAIGHFADADRLYAAALADLDTTSPFPHAWLYFARGLMWAEGAGDRARGEAFYVQSLAHLPEFAAANIHLAEIEMARGDLKSAEARLARVAAADEEPEALARLGECHLRAGQVAQGTHEIARARDRYESLLARHPLAFADHAAEFYLGPGADPERAWVLAAQNLANRQTDRAFALAIQAAHATGRDRDARALAIHSQLSKSGD